MGLLGVLSRTATSCRRTAARAPHRDDRARACPAARQGEQGAAGGAGARPTRGGSPSESRRDARPAARTARRAAVALPYWDGSQGDRGGPGHEREPFSRGDLDCDLAEAGLGRAWPQRPSSTTASSQPASKPSNGKSRRTAGRWLVPLAGSSERPLAGRPLIAPENRFFPLALMPGLDEAGAGCYAEGSPHVWDRRGSRNTDGRGAA